MLFFFIENLVNTEVIKVIDYIKTTNKILFMINNFQNFHQKSYFRKKIQKNIL